MPRLTGGRALVDALCRHGVDTLFALPGIQNDELFAALYDARNAIRVIHTRHEQGAAYMAYGYARSTGRVGAYAVVPGPGLLNTTAALATAYAANTPVLCIAGQSPSAMIGRGFGLLHEIPDSLQVLRSLTKWAARIDDPARTPEFVAEAFAQLRSGRPRPVALEMPMDIMAREAEVNSEATAAMGPSPAPDPEMIAQAAKLLAAASKPMIVVGGGAADAAAEIQSIAEQLQAPVVTYQSGRGILSARHHLSVSPPIGHCLWKDTDVVLAVGTRLHPQQTAWGVDDRLKIVRIDIDPAEITRVRSPAVGIAGDARAALAALVRALAPHGCRASSEAGLTALKLRFAAEFAALEPQMSYLTAIRDVLPDDGIFVDELTQVGYVARFAFPVYRPRTYITSGYQGTLGYGFATALGAKVAHPDKPVVSISGDGGFLYNVPELATAVLHGIAVVAVVFADGAFGNVRRIQKTKYGGRVIATDLRNPDFVRLARDFGAAGARANTPEELRRELRAAFERPGPTVIEVPVGEMPEPWHFIHMPRVRG